MSRIAEAEPTRDIGAGGRTGGALAWLGVLLAAGAALRLFYLDALGYNSDEAVYAGQAAALAEAPVLSDLFPIFRAHPLLFHLGLSVLFRFGVADLTGRLLAVAVGVATIALVYRLGVELYGRRAGLYAALFLALMPYHVVVTRQVLLDGPLTLAATLTLFCLARFAASGKVAWLYATGATLGLSFLTKETGILFLGSIYAFLALAPEIRVRIRDVAISLALAGGIAAAHPLSALLAGGGGQRRTQQYFLWQLFRRPNHDWDFYLTTVAPAIGPLLLATALAGLWLLRRRHGWREKLLLVWILVPAAFFQLWPTKGFAYLLPATPALALLAARLLAHRPRGEVRLGGRRLPRKLGAVLAASIAVSLAIPSWSRVHPSASTTFLAGSGGVPGGREAGLWIADHLPAGATLVTIGPSMANVLKFYGHKKTLGLSVSPNPQHRNPAYEPVGNLDFEIRRGAVQYLVWDAYSAGRSWFFSDKLLWYARKYHGRVVHTETVPVTSAAGEVVGKPVIVIYGVRP